MVLLDLPLWIKSGSDILSFVASTPAFQREGITSQQLLRLRRMPASRSC